MKIIVLSLLLCTSISFSQSLEKNEVDEFTGEKVKATEWMGFAYTLDGDMRYRLCMVDTVAAINIKMILSYHDIYSVSKGDELLIKLSTNEVLKGKSIKSVFSCKGCGAVDLMGSKAYGLNTMYYIDKKTLQKLKTTPIAKIRIYTSAGTVERELKPKRAEKFIKSVNLLN